MTKIINPDALSKKLTIWMRRQKPKAKQVRLDNFTRPEAGASNETILFDAKWQQEGLVCVQRYVIRLEVIEDGIFQYYDLEKQYKALVLLASTQVKVPKVLAYEYDKNFLGRAFYVMEAMPGKVVAEQPPYHLDGWFTDLSDEQRNKLWHAGICVIAEVNQLDWKTLGFDYLLPKVPRTCLQQQLYEYRVFLSWVENRGRDYPALRSMLAWLFEHQPRDEPIALCWGDAKVANLLYDDVNVSAVLDWEMLHLGNPVSDLAWWMTLDDSMSEGLERLVGMKVAKQPGLLSKNEMVALWEEKSGYSAKNLDYYEVLAAFKFGVIMTSVSLNLTKNGIMPKDMHMDINHTCTPIMDRLIKKYGIEAEAF